MHAERGNHQPDFDDTATSKAKCPGAIFRKILYAYNG